MNSRLNLQSILKILIIEDNPGDILIFKEHLRFSRINFELIESNSLKDAIEKISHRYFDVILLDLGLPDSLGIETLKKLNLSSLRTPVIVMTGLDDEDTAVESLKEGAQDYLFKNNIDSQKIIHSITYSIERKKIQEIQKKNVLQFSTLASATASINESEEIEKIFDICCNKISELLNEFLVFPIESMEEQKQCKALYKWLEMGFVEKGRRSLNEIRFSILKILEGIYDFFRQNSTNKLIQLKRGLKEFNEIDSEFLIELEKIVSIENIYTVGFKKNEREYGGIIIFSGRSIDSDEISLIEVLSNQVSLSIHRRMVEKDLIASEYKYRILNKELEQRVTERTKDLAETNQLLEEELGVRIKLEQELIISKNELELRVKERTAELAKSEERFHNMFYNHEAIMLLINPENGKIIEANISAKNFYGHSFYPVNSLSIFDINILPEEEIRNNIRKAVNQKSNYYIFPQKLASGEIKIVEVYSSPIEMTGEKLLFSIIHDITQRKQIESALQESEALYRAVVNNSLNIIIITVNNVIEFINQAAVDFTGIVEEEIIGKEIDEVFRLAHIGTGNSFAGSIQDSLKNNYGIEVQIFEKLNPGVCYFLIRSNTIQYRGKEAILTVFTDITENKNVEKYVLRRVIETEENDRKKFAADLHDDLGPILSTIKLRLDLMRNTDKINDELKENILISNELTGLVVEKIRTISHNITPHLIETLGLEASVRDLCKKIKELNKIEILFESNIETMRFSQSLELHYYRILSELINNSLKHSQASIIRLKILIKDNMLELTYTDNGIGYNYSECLHKPGGIGLRNILNRVTLIDGMINFQIHEGKTIVKILKEIKPVFIK